MLVILFDLATNRKDVGASKHELAHCVHRYCYQETRFECYCGKPYRLMCRYNGGLIAVQGVPFGKIYNAEKKYAANKAGMDTMRPNELIVDDIVLLEMTIGRYYDMVGKVHSDWTSIRAVFRLDAVSLLRRGDAPVEEEVKPASSKSKKVRRAPMDVSM